MIAIRCAALLLLFVCGATSAAAEDILDPNDQWEFGIGIGVVHWPDLVSVSTPEGEFDSAGFSLDLFAHKSLGYWGNYRLSLGVDVGGLFADSSIPGAFRPLSMSGAYFVPSIRLGLNQHSRFQLEAGAGWYQVDLTEFECDNVGIGCVELAEAYSSGTFGGFVGARANISNMLHINARVHAADFDSVIDVHGINVELAGPIVAISGGFVF